MEPSRDQEAALRRITEWHAAIAARWGEPAYCRERGHAPYPHTHPLGGGAIGVSGVPVLALGGLAGTGKTTVTRLLEERVPGLAERVSYAAPTHKAAGVLREKLGGAPERVRTMHSLLYHPRVSRTCGRSGERVVSWDHACSTLVGEDGDCSCPGRFRPCGAHGGECDVRESPFFSRREYLPGHARLLVVDEASMLTREHVEDARALGLPVLLVGDHGQLPPVKAPMNPWLARPDAVLEVNHRQGEGSGIIELAHRVRRGERPVAGETGDGYAVLSRRAHGPAVRALLERFEPGPERVVVTWRNATRTALNHFYARGVETGAPVPGDRVACLKTTGAALVEYRANGEHSLPHALPVTVANGELGTVLERVAVRDRTVTLIVKLDGADRPAVLVHAALHQFGEPRELALNDPRRPPLRTGLWDYGYAITAHKAQGSEFEEVIVIDEGASDYERWTYTAVTRASKRLVVVRW